MNKLQLYFDYYVEHHNPKTSDTNERTWYEEMEHAITLLNAIKDGIPSKVDFKKSSDKKKLLETSFADSTSSFTEHVESIESLLDRFVFKQYNGVGNIKQGTVYDTEKSPHRDSILINATPECIYNILSNNNIEEVNKEVDKLLNDRAGRNYPAVSNRFMRTLFPHNFGSPDATDKLDRLINAIRTKLGIIITGETILEKHQNLCSQIATHDPILRQIFTWELFYILENELSLKKAICYYGAPGTGKTYQSLREAKKLIDAHRIIIGRPIGGSYSIKTVQFHPSYSYEDFMEGIRPSIAGNLKLFNGSFKQFCKDNGEKEIDLYMKTNFLSKSEFQNVEYDFARIKINQLDQEEKKILGLTAEVYAEGCTIQDAIEPAFFIIDEINRAELSKVFGELMYSLEYRGYQGKIKTQYSHLCQSETDESTYYWENNENWFFIPQNIYLIATMNNIDRSVDAFDFALRRRFMWAEVEPNYIVIENELEKARWGEKEAKLLSQKLKTLNDLIENDEILDKNYRIGQSYVLELTKLSPDRFDSQNKATEFIWKNFIAPLLEEYLKGLGNEDKAKTKISKFKEAFV